MTIFFYSSFDCEEGQYLVARLRKIFPRSSFEVFHHCSDLAFRLLHPKDGASVTVILASTSDELLKFFPVREMISDTILVIVLSEEDPTILSLAHQLRPKYVGFPGSHDSELISVLRKIVDRSAPCDGSPRSAFPAAERRGPDSSSSGMRPRLRRQDSVSSGKTNRRRRTSMSKAPREFFESKVEAQLISLQEDLEEWTFELENRGWESDTEVQRELRESSLKLRALRSQFEALKACPARSWTDQKNDLEDQMREFTMKFQDAAARWSGESLE